MFRLEMLGEVTTVTPMNISYHGGVCINTFFRAGGGASRCEGHSHRSTNEDRQIEDRWSKAGSQKYIFCSAAVVGT